MMKPLLSDGTLCLRAVEPTDLDRLTAWENDTSLWEYGCTVAPLSRKLMWDYIEHYQPDIYAARQLRLVAADEASGVAVGLFDLYDFDPHNRRAGVGVLVDPEWQGRGYCRRMLALGADYAGRFIGMRQIWAVVPADNVRSLAAFRSSGFTDCGRLCSWLRRGGEYADAIMMQYLL